MSTSDPLPLDQPNNPQRRNIPIHRKILYSVVVVGIVFICGELASRLIIAATPNARWRFHENIVKTVGFGELNDILEPHPKRFWRVRPNIDRKILRGRILDSAPMAFTVSTDDAGHRRMAEVSGANQTVLFLGDSCTFGISVNDEETFSALLQDRIDGLQCINAGVPGYSTFQGRVTLEDMPFDSVPDVVVISFLFNDEAPWDGLSDHEHARQLAQEQARLIPRSRLMTLLASLKPHPKNDNQQTQRPRLTDLEYADELQRIVGRCRSMGSQTILMIWPMIWQMNDTHPIGKQNVTRQMADAEDVLLIDLVSLFRSHGAERLFADVVHANAEGHQIVAGRLESVLRENSRARVAKQK